MDVSALKPDDLLPVLAGQVKQYAKSSCRTCFGLGHHGMRHVKRDRYNRVVSDNSGQTLCDCAIKRFLKSNPKVVYDPKSGQYYWPITVSQFYGDQRTDSNGLDQPSGEAPNNDGATVP